MSGLGLKLRKLFRWNNNNTSEAQQLLLSSGSGTTVNNVEQQEETTIIKTSAAPVKERMISLDVMRGMTIMLMIIVNNQPSKAFYLLDHAEWFGMTPT